MILIKDRHLILNPHRCRFLFLENMILIKDRHFVPWSEWYPQFTAGKYDTYKGSTLAF